MVRRWSYLNQLNTNTKVTITSNPNHNSLLLKVFQQTAFKATTYYRKPLYNPLITKITRKNFYRRRHLNNWLVYQNILTLWAKEYLFFRKYSRTLMSLFFYKNNFLMYNVLVHANSNVSDLRGYENIHMTHLVRSLKFFLKNNNSLLFPFLKSLKNFSLNWLSTPTLNFFATPKAVTSWEALYVVTQNQLLAKPKQQTFDGFLPVLFQINYQQQLNFHLEVYKLFIFLTWMSLLKQ